MSLYKAKKSFKIDKSRFGVMLTDLSVSKLLSGRLGEGGIFGQRLLVVIFCSTKFNIVIKSHYYIMLAILIDIFLY